MTSIKASASETMTLTKHQLLNLKSPENMDKLFPAVTNVKCISGDKYVATFKLLNILERKIEFVLKENGTHFYGKCTYPTNAMVIVTILERDAYTLVQVDADIELPRALGIWKKRLQSELEDRIQKRLQDIKNGKIKV